MSRCRTCTLHHRPTCTPIPQRWPLGPLIEAVGGAARPGRGRTRDLAAALGVSGESVRTAAEFGLTDHQADRWAVRCGWHPAAIWAGWIDAGLTELDRDYLTNGWRQAWEWNQTRTEPAEAAA